MDTNRLVALGHQYRYDSWAGVKRDRDDLHVWRFAFSGTEVSGCRPVRIELPQRDAVEPPSLRIDTSRRRADMARDAIALVPRLVKSFWQPRDEGRELFNVDVYECESRPAAHALLLRLLGEFSAALLVREDAAGIGDVLFVVPGNTAVVFARGNLAHVVRNASRHAADVMHVARDLDQRLVNKPAASPRAAGLRANVQPGRVVLRRLTMRGAGPALYYKFFFSNGTMNEERGELVYRPVGTGSPEIGVVAIYPERAGLYRVLKVKS